MNRFEAAWFDALGAALASDPLYRRIGGHFAARILFQEGDRAAVVRLEGGRIAEAQAPPPLTAPWDFALRGDAAAWDDFLAPVPRPGCQSIFALAKAGRMRVEGNWLVLIQNLWALTRFLELMRAHAEAARHAAS